MHDVEIKALWKKVLWKSALEKYRDLGGEYPTYPSPIRPPRFGFGFWKEVGVPTL